LNLGAGPGDEDSCCSNRGRAAGLKIMQTITRRSFALAGVLLLALSAAACGDNEPEQRKAFIAFLQTRIVDKPGVHVAKPTEEEIKAFGPYAAHYAVMLDFLTDSDLSAMNKKLNDALPTLRSAQDLVDHRVEVRAAGEKLGGVLNAMDAKFAETKKAREALKQPDDLKAVYDAAFDKVINKPVQGFHEVTPIAQEITAAAARLGDYIYAHRDTVKIVGTSPQATDRKTQNEVNALATALSSNGARYNEAQKRLRIILLGS
jgi:hypothetical protein